MILTTHQAIKKHDKALDDIARNPLIIGLENIHSHSKEYPIEKG